MIQRMLASAMFAGVTAGLLAAALHFFFLQGTILLSEQYEAGAVTHFAGAASDGHSEGHGTAAGDETGETAQIQAQGDGAQDAVQRNGLTVLFMALVYVGYGLMLVAGFAFAERFGHRITVRQGLLWGLAGFAAFQLMPAMGLSPELPGMPAADLTARQLWWLATALCTAGALALIGYGKGLPAFGLAILLLALPHLVGAPTPEGFAGVVPPELASAFAARALGVGLIVWAALGWLAAYFWNGKAA